MNRLNMEQRKSLSNFFNGLAVAWAVAVFVGPNVNLSKNLIVSLLTIGIYIVNMVVALGISLYLIREPKR